MAPASMIAWGDARLIVRIHRSAVGATQTLGVCGNDIGSEIESRRCRYRDTGCFRSLFGPVKIHFGASTDAPSAL